MIPVLRFLADFAGVDDSEADSEEIVTAVSSLGKAQAASEAFVAVCRRERGGGQRTTPAGEFDGQKALCSCGKLCTEPRF